jgi:ATP-binding cassette subfamily B protein
MLIGKTNTSPELNCNAAASYSKRLSPTLLNADGAMNSALLRLLRSHLRPYRRELGQVAVLQALQVGVALLLPRLNADIIDIGVARGDTGYIWARGGLMVLVSAVQVVFSIAAVYVGSKIGMGFGRDVRRDLFFKVTDFSAREVADLRAPSLITRVTNDVQQVQMLVYMTCTLLLAAPITAIGGLVMAWREDARLSVVLFVAIPVLIVSIGSVIFNMVPTFRRMQERIDDLNRVLREQISGVRVLRAFVRERYETERFAKHNEELARQALRGGRLMGLMFPTVTVVVNVSSVAVVWLGAGRVDNGELQLGSLIAFLIYVTQVLMAIMMATFIAALAPRAAVSSERIIEVLDTASSVTSPPNPVPFGNTPSLRLDSVGFRYPGAEHAVLADVDVHCVAGETLAVIGSTGSGKTTLVNMIARLHDVSQGSVLINGSDVRHVALDDLWQRIALVPQRPYLFGGTVASNLRFGNQHATDAELWEALTVAQARDFVDGMGGLEAAIIQGGSNLSGGQRQRLAIARAVVRRPDIYLFDDSFSALDMATDAKLRAALEPVTRRAVVVVVGQRVSSIRHASQILVLDDGEVMGLGSHDELLRTCATYEEIVSSQFTGAEVEELIR